MKSARWVCMAHRNLVETTGVEDAGRVESLLEALQRRIRAPAADGRRPRRRAAATEQRWHGRRGPPARADRLAPAPSERSQRWPRPTPPAGGRADPPPARSLAPTGATGQSPGKERRPGSRSPRPGASGLGVRQALAAQPRERRIHRRHRPDRRRCSTPPATRWPRSAAAGRPGIEPVQRRGLRRARSAGVASATGRGSTFSDTSTIMPRVPRLPAIARDTS